MTKLGLEEWIQRGRGVDLTLLSKPALKKETREHEQKIKMRRNEFIFQESGDFKLIDKWLEEIFKEIEPFYREIMRRHLKPGGATIPSKINSEKESLGELTYP